MVALDKIGHLSSLICLKTGILQKDPPDFSIGRAGNCYMLGVFNYPEKKLLASHCL
jgi:hypothetical protein